MYEAVAGHVTAPTVSLPTPQGRLDARASAHLGEQSPAAGPDRAPVTLT